MNVVSESILVRCQYVAMAVCAAGVLFCWGKSITHLHDPALLVDRAAQIVRTAFASIQREADANLNDRVGGSFPTAVLRPSYGAAILYPPPINAAWSVMLEGAAFECGLYRTILGTYSETEVPSRSVRAITGRTCPGTSLSTPNDDLTAIR